MNKNYIKTLKMVCRPGTFERNLHSFFRNSLTRTNTDQRMENSIPCSMLQASCLIYIFFQLLPLFILSVPFRSLVGPFLCCRRSSIFRYCDYFSSLTLFSVIDTIVEFLCVDYFDLLRNIHHRRICRIFSTDTTKRQKQKRSENRYNGAKH